MNILLDENVPVQATEVLRCTLRGHSVEHVDRYSRRGTLWKGKPDRHLLPDMREAGFNVFVTRDNSQLSDPDETRLIRLSGIHHVRFQQSGGREGYARAVGALTAAMFGIVEELAGVTGQRLVRIHGLDPRTRRYDIVDPHSEPPAYWRGSGRRGR